MKSILIIGMSRFGHHLAKQLYSMGNDVVVVDKNEELMTQFTSEFTDVQIGDCTNEGVIRSLGVQNFDICIVAVGSDFQSSLVITSLLEKMGASFIVSRAKQDIQEELLYKIGAKEVICPEKSSANALAVKYSSNNIFDYIPLAKDYSIYEIKILPSWAGNTIAGLNIRQRYKINIIAVKRNGNLIPSPSPQFQFVSGDHAVVIGYAADVAALDSENK